MIVHIMALVVTPSVCFVLSRETCREVRKGLSVGETVVASGTLFIDRAAKRD